MSNQQSVWQLVGEYSERNPAGDLYVQPNRDGIEEHMEWAVDLERWIVWEWTEAGQKVPHRGAHPSAKSSWQDLDNAVSFDEAWTSYEEHDHLAGVGFVFSEELDEVLEDFDNVINPNNSNIEDVLEDALKSSSEPAFVSSSGTGAHRYPIGTKAQNTTRHPHEVYTTERFAAVTGHCINSGSGLDEDVQVDHGEDLSEELNRISKEYNQSSGSGADIGDIEFDTDPVKLDEGDWDAPEKLQNAPDDILAIVKALSTEHPEEVGWGQNTFGRYTYLLMLLARYDSDPERMAELASSFYCPMVAETQKGNHFKKPKAPTPYGLGVPWDLDEQAQYISRKISSGELSAPSVESIEEKCNVEIGECDCQIHSEDKVWDGNYGLIVPDTPVNRADPTKSVGPNLDHEQVMKQTEEFMEKSLSMNVNFVAAPEPGTGKSRGSIRAIAHSGELATIAVNVNSNKFETAEYLQELSTEYALYPSTTMTGEEHELAVDTHCPVACDEHGEAERKRLRDLAEKCGGSPGLAHAIASNEDSAIESFACQRDGDCNYTESWEDFNGSAQVLIGHYSHLNLDSAMALRSPDGYIIEERTVIVDEFPGEAFETTMSYEELSKNIRTWLGTFTEQKPTGDVYEALDNVSPLDKLRRASTVEDLYDIYVPWELVSPQQDTEDDVPGPIESAVEEGYHPDTPVIAYMLSKSERMSNDWRSAQTSRKSLAMSPDGTTHFINPPQFASARQLVGLDATANKHMWRVATGMRELPVVETMNRAQKRSYYQDALDLDIMQLSQSMRPFASVDKPDNDVFREDDVGAVVDYLKHISGNSEAGVISSLAGFDQMEKHGIDVSDLVTNHYGNFKGDNSMRNINYGALIGALHPGDYPIYKWAALAGECAERDEAPDGDRSDWEVNYQNDVADSVMNTIIDGEVKQALMRFSRNDETGVVLIYTNRIPDEVPRREADLRRFVQSRVDVLEALDSGARSFDQVNTAVNWSRRTVRRAVDELEDLGLVEGDNEDLRSTNRVSDYAVIADNVPIIEYKDTVRSNDEAEEHSTDSANVRSGLLGLEYLAQCNRIQILENTGLAVAATPTQLATGDENADPQARFTVDS